MTQPDSRTCTHGEVTTDVVRSTIQCRKCGASASLTARSPAEDEAYKAGRLAGFEEGLEAAPGDDALRAAASEGKLEKLTRLQSAHHRMLRVTAVTCAACKKERSTLRPSHDPA